MKRFLTFLFVLLTYCVFSQVTFIIESLPESTPDEDFIYIAGSFNDWNPGDPDFKLEKNSENKWEIQLDAQAEGSSVEFKFTRGDWGTVEKDANGNEMANRIFTFGNGETVEVEIANWADVGGGNSTAAENVSIMDANFYMPQLDRNRRIWIYLPPDYEESTKAYPVLYMHDGQNLFDANTAFAGEWEVDETLNELFEEGVNVPIVVGIDNGGAHRLDEYSAWVNTNYGGGEGDAYIQFIVETLKPHIDANYRTQTDASHTGIMGSSLGGFISQYAVFQYQDVFKKAGLFSPSYWYSDSVWAFTEDFGDFNNQRVYQIVGSEEGGSMVDDMNEMHELLLDQGFSSDHLFSKVVQGQGHNEAFWRSEFKEAYLWLFNDFASGVEDIPLQNPPLVYPNPATEKIHININGIDSLRLFDTNGNIIVEKQNMSNNYLDIEYLKPSLFFIEVYANGEIYYSKFLKL